MTLWITGDTHFNHYNIQEYCHRPANHEDLMYAALSKIQPSDTLIHVGDFAWGNRAKLEATLDKIPLCHKVLVAGNHDDRRKWFRDRWDGGVHDEYSMNHGNHSFYFKHEPIAVSLLPVCDVFVHAHQHDLGTKFQMVGITLVVCASVELWDYNPIDADYLVNLFRVGIQ
jgi:calcineurin-like phosphoesterase family protein